MTRYRKAKVTLILAVGVYGVQHWKLYHGSANSECFANFVSDIPKLPHQVHLLMDNVSFHKSTCVTDVLRRRGMHALFNAPYTPEWNPVEYIFSKVKRAFVRGRHPSEYENRDEYIEDRVSAALETVTDTDTNNCFAHCWRLATSGTVENLIFQGPPHAV